MTLVRTAHRTGTGVATLAVLSVLCVMLAAAAEAAGSARELYEAALAREQRIRIVLAGDGVPDTANADVRAIVAAYQEVVRRYPTSGYSDNALWQGGVLALDAFALFRQERDRSTGVRLLRLLASEYPSSGLVSDVPAQLARIDAPASGTARLVPPKEPETPAQQAVRAGMAAQRTPPIATITAIRREVLPDAVRITIELDREVPFRDERIGGPVRVFVDLPSTRAAAAIFDKTLRFDGDNDIVRQIRIGRHPGNMTRIVLDGADVSSYSVYPMYQPYRLVIDCVRTLQPAVPTLNAAKVPDPVRTPVVPTARALPALPLAAPPVPTPNAAATPAVAAAPANSPAAADSPSVFPSPPSVVPPLPATMPPPPAVVPPVKAIAAAPVPAPPPAEPLPAITSTTAPPRNLGGGYSMARQLGLSVSRIVIDPGHGGHDPGAKGKSIDEAELVLDVALRVEQLLQKVPGIEVILTRRTDEFVPLPERTAIANREGADLFLSIHANASPNASARGVETYFLNFASNMSAASVAARENAASGQSMGALPDFLKAIALNNKLDESRDFAAAVQAAMIDRLRKSNKSVKDLGVKQAPFVVLIGAAMPSVLAEISFLTNTQEAKLLRADAYRQRIAEALVAAIRKYQSSLKNIPKVAQQ
jgi:N-acetylmuramoyl-L-alanine amidase